MQRYRMNFSTREMRKLRADCLVIGSGAAGLQAARTAAGLGRSVLLAVRDTLLDSNTNKAQGGIAASFGTDDNPSLHLQDTLVAGAGLSNEEISRLVVTEGPRDVAELSAHGAVFDRRPDGQLALGREGCHSRRRIVHAQGDATGAEVARSLLALASREQRIQALEHCYVVDLLTRRGRCYGAVALLAGEPVCLLAGAVILATGGCGQLFLHTTNPAGALGSGIAMAYRAGAAVMDMEFVQFHPTALALPGCPSFLISEAVRGAGALLQNARGERFMPRYHPMAELAPRDVVARAIFQEMEQAGEDHLYLDARKVSGAAEKFPMIARTCREYGVDISREPIPVAPAAHYMMGGVRTDAWGRTNIAGLYACGEAACTGLQGANRLASNSLLEGLVFGRRAGKQAAVDGLRVTDGLDWHSEGLRPAEVSELSRQTLALQRGMSRWLGICREGAGLSQAVAWFASLSLEYDGLEARSPEMLDFFSRLQLGSLMAWAALRRRESRGAHYRSDFPETLAAWRCHVADVKKKNAKRIGEKPYGITDVRNGQSALALA